MQLKKFSLLLTLLTICASIAHGQQWPIYPSRPLTPADIARKQAIPEWYPKTPTTRNEEKLPSGVDNSALKYFPEIFNQRGNSCSQASGVRYVFSYEVNRMLDRNAKASTDNVFAYHFTWNCLNNAVDEGSHPELGYDMMKVAGAATLTDMPDESDAVSSTTWITGYDKYVKAMHYRVKDYAKFSLKTKDGIQRLKQYLYNRGESGKVGGIVTFSCYSSDWSMKDYQGASAIGLKDIITKIGTDGAHALTIVGYDDTVEYDLDGNGSITEDERGAFIFANTWDNWWGSDGRCYYPYKLFLMPASEGGLADLDAEALMVNPEIHEPQVVFKVDLTYTSRNDLFFRLGVADGLDAKSPSIIFPYPMFLNQGGDVYMRGDGTAESYKTIELGLNFTDKVAEYSHYKNPKYFLIVRKIANGKSGNGTVNSFSVVDYLTGKEYVSKQKGVAITGETVLSTSDIATSKVSASKHTWLQSDGKQVLKLPFIIRTANGKQVKMQFVNRNENGDVTIKYQTLE